MATLIEFFLIVDDAFTEKHLSAGCMDVVDDGKRREVLIDGLADTAIEWIGVANRSCVPIHWVSCDGSRVVFFQATSGSSLATLGDMRVLFVRCEGDKVLSVVERCGRARLLFAMSRLHESVRLSDVRGIMSEETSDMVDEENEVDDDTDVNDWWKRCAVEMNTRSERTRMIRWEQPEIVVASDDIVSSSLLEHYLNALYSNKVTLAHFVKSTLARVVKAKESLEWLTLLMMTSQEIEIKYRMMSGFLEGESKECNVLREGELDHVVSWKNTSTMPAQERIMTLKTQETQLQLIITLQILCLEKQEGTKRDKIEQYLHQLVDRLCIYQMSTDTFAFLKDDKGNEESDQLKQFCMQIVWPYYGVHMPDLCRAVCAKCGVSFEIQEEQQQQQQQSKEHEQVRRASSRSSSITSTSKQRLSSLLKRDINSKKANGRGAMFKELQRIDNRQIDLPTRKKQQKVKVDPEQLSMAIDALRKPDPRKVGAEIADAADRRRLFVGRERKGKSALNPFVKHS